MRRLLQAAVVISTLGFTMAAQAEPAAPSRVDVGRLELARQIIETNGGAKAFEQNTKAYFETLNTTMRAAFPAETPKALQLREALLTYLSQEQAKAAPMVLDETAKVYAEHLSEPELRALLTWSQSDVGRSIQAKTPSIMRELMQRQMPTMLRLLRGGADIAIARACAENQCTPAQRQTLTSIVEKVGPKS